MTNRLTYSSHLINLGPLTPNEKSQFIKRELERRRLIRYIQVRQQSAENARIIRDRVRRAKEREMMKIKNEIASSIVRRMSREPTVLSPIETSPTSTQVNFMSGKYRNVTAEDDERAAKRHKEALKKLRTERQAKRIKKISALERRKIAERLANLRCRSQVR